MDMIEYGIMSINKDLMRMNHQSKNEDPHSTNRIGSQIGQPILTDRMITSPLQPLSGNKEGVIVGEQTLISSMPHIAI